MQWKVYIARCKNGDLYTGITRDLQRRMTEHNTGVGGRFTRTFRPVELLYEECYLTEHEARMREVQLKAWSRRKKLALITGDRKQLQAA